MKRSTLVVTAVAVGIVSLVGCATLGRGAEHTGHALSTFGVWLAGEGAKVAAEAGGWLSRIGEMVGGPIGVTLVSIGTLITGAGTVSSIRNSDKKKIFGPVIEGRKWCGLKKDCKDKAKAA